MAVRSRALVAGLAGLLLLAGCAWRQAQPSDAQPQAETARAVDLVEIRYQASVTHDNRKSSDERTRAANAAWSTLLAYLTRPESRDLPVTEWEMPLAEGVGPFVRVQESGTLRLYAIPLPVPGGEPPFERVAAQWQAADGRLFASELKSLPGGRLLTHHLVVDRGNPQALVVLWEYPNRGRGFAGHFQWERSEFRLVAGAFAGLPKEAGTTQLDVRDGFLTVQQAGEDRWVGAEFDRNFPLRFYVHPDWYLDFERGKYAIGDDRAPGMYQAFAEAHDRNVPRERRQAQWLKATRRLPIFLGDLEGWRENLAGKLPKGSAILTDQTSNISLRLISIPTPEFMGGHFTVAQFRISSGLPTAQPVYIPGAAVAAKIFTNEGLPGIMVVSTRADGFAVTLLKLDFDGLWEKAPEWYGWLPGSIDNWQMKREDHHLFFFPPADGVLQVTGTPPVIEACQGSLCVPLDFKSGKLSAAPWLAASLTRMPASDAAQVEAAIGLVQQFMASPHAKDLTDQQFEQIFTIGQVAAFTVGSLQLIGLPVSAAGTAPLLVHWEGGSLVETPAPGAVHYWISARPLDDANVAVVGRTGSGAVLLVFRKEGPGWRIAPDAVAPVAVQAGSLRFDAPSPVAKGLSVQGTTAMSVAVTRDGTTYFFCQSQNAGCVRFVWEGGQLAGPR
jgi:hypothetical protein